MPYRSPACNAGRHAGSQNNHPPAPTTTVTATKPTATTSHRRPGTLTVTQRRPPRGWPPVTGSAVGRVLRPAFGTVLPVLLAAVAGPIHDVRRWQDRLGVSRGGHVGEVGLSRLQQIIGVAGQLPLLPVVVGARPTPVVVIASIVRRDPQVIPHASCAPFLQLLHRRLGN